MCLCDEFIPILGGLLRSDGWRMPGINQRSSFLIFNGYGIERVFAPPPSRPRVQNAVE